MRQLDGTRVFIDYGAQALVAQWLRSLKDYPIRQMPANFNPDEIMQKLSPAR